MAWPPLFADSLLAARKEVRKMVNSFFLYHNNNANNNNNNVTISIEDYKNLYSRCSWIRVCSMDEERNASYCMGVKSKRGLRKFTNLEASTHYAVMYNFDIISR